MTPTTPEQIRDFVTAAHGDFEKVKSMLAEIPELLNAAHPWSETDHETALMAAAQVGNRVIAEYLLKCGAPLDICTGAMLGRGEAVKAQLEKDPKLIHARGAHGIPLLAHAAMNGDVALVRILVESGASEGLAFALHNAVLFHHDDLVRWLLENTQPDLSWKNWQGKTALTVALEGGFESMAALLKEHGATV